MPSWIPDLSTASFPDAHPTRHAPHPSQHPTERGNPVGSIQRPVPAGDQWPSSAARCNHPLPIAPRRAAPAGSSPPPTLVRTRTPSTTHLAATLRASQPSRGPSRCPRLAARSEALPVQPTMPSLPRSQPIPFPAANAAVPAASRPRRQRLAPACEATLPSTGRHPLAAPMPSPRRLHPTRDRHCPQPPTPRQSETLASVNPRRPVRSSNPTRQPPQRDAAIHCWT